MTPYYTALALGYSVAIPAVIGLVRLRITEPAYRPFIFIMWLGLINHTVSIVANRMIGSNAINSNIYVLFEALLYLVLFYNWRVVGRSQKPYLVTAVLLAFLWTADNFLFHSITVTNSFYRIVCSLVLLFFAITKLTGLIVSSSKRLLRDARFLICTGIIIYFSFKATMEVFFLTGVRVSASFQIKIFFIMIFVNLFVNLIFAVAAVCIPRKQPFMPLP